MDRRRFVRSALTATATLATSTLPFSGIVFAAAPTTRLQPVPTEWSNDSVTACWVGHSTVLLNVHGTIILTDPVLFNDIGVSVLGTTFGLSRLVQPALRIEDIPRPDIVLLSHAHMDHMDIPTLERLTSLYPDHIRCVCAKHTKDLIDDLPWKRLSELDWWESISVGDVSITAIEVLHNGWRLPWEPDRRAGQIDGRSYNGYVISSKSVNVVFGGDTAYTEAFKELRAIPIDCAFMPIGAYQGYTDNHCTPEEAVDISQMMGVQNIAPIHCLTFRQSMESYAEPMQRFHRYTQACGLRASWSRIGQTHVIPNTLQAAR